jgi:hypothetical protein
VSLTVSSGLRVETVLLSACVVVVTMMIVGRTGRCRYQLVSIS